MANIDETEPFRREMVAQINGAVESDNKDTERARLEKEYGKVWSTDELRIDFEVIGFAAPLIVVKRRSDGKKGSLFFTHSPRYYFSFKED